MFMLLDRLRLPRRGSFILAQQVVSLVLTGFFNTLQGDLWLMNRGQCGFDLFERGM